MPVTYAGGVNSTTFLHTEDQDLRSLNVNTTDGVKGWIAIPKGDNNENRSLLERKVRELFAKKSKKPIENVCPKIIHHKDEGLVFTPNQLDKWAVNYIMFEQHPGDLVALNRGVLHQVINITPNFANAINYALKEDVGKEASCMCNCSIEITKKNFLNLTKDYSCPFEDCGKEEERESDRKKHLVEDHNQLESKPYPCFNPACESTFCEIYKALTHHQTQHKGDYDKCSICGHSIIKSNRAMHNNKKHPKTEKELYYNLLFVLVNKISN